MNGQPEWKESAGGDTLENVLLRALSARWRKERVLTGGLLDGWIRYLDPVPEAATCVVHAPKCVITI